MPDGLTGQFGIALGCLQVAMTELPSHRANSHATVHQLRRGRVPKLVDLAFDLCLITQLGPLIQCGPITHALIFVFSFWPS